MHTQSVYVSAQRAGATDSQGQLATCMQQHAHNTDRHRAAGPRPSDSLSLAEAYACACAQAMARHVAREQV